MLMRAVSVAALEAGLRRMPRRVASGLLGVLAERYPMKSSRLVSAVLAHVLVAAALLCCGGSNQTRGETNMQVPGSPGVPPKGQCLERGTECLTDNDCCSGWCANGVCARKTS
jgi:hypothetical protein